MGQASPFTAQTMLQLITCYCLFEPTTIYSQLVILSMVQSKHAGRKTTFSCWKIPRRGRITQLIMLSRQRPREQEFIRFLRGIFRAWEVESFGDCEQGDERTHEDGNSRRPIVGEERRDRPRDTELRWVRARVPAGGFEFRWRAGQAVHRGVQRDWCSLPRHAQTSSILHGCGMFTVIF